MIYMGEYQIAKDIMELRQRVEQIEAFISAAIEADKKALEEKNKK